MFTAVYSRAWVFPLKGVEVGYYYIFTYDLVIAIGGILILFVSEIAEIIAIVMIWIIGLPAFVICIN